MDVTLLAPWIARQRWYRRTGEEPRLRVLGELPLESLDPAAHIRILLVLDASGSVPTVYQVPVVERTREVLLTAVIGEAGGVSIVDGPYDPAFGPALLWAMTGDREAGLAVSRSAVLSGEQSNTSVLIERPDAPPAVAKVFRVLHHGQNPDAELQRELSDAGVPFVPRFVGELLARWPDATGAESEGHLAIAQEFVAGAEDGWDLALRSAAAGTDLRATATALGSATAVLHAVLAERLPVRAAQPADIDATATLWRSRLESATALAPPLVPLAAAIEGVYRAAQAEPWPVLQRIHGDLHLGQLLHRAADDRWVFLDFEGEPLRTLAERTAPEPALRDVAGMLRSFDYAAAFGHASDASWARNCTDGYLAGYAEVAGDAADVHRQLLEAFELDKAVYEVVYEVRNRPDWVGIPLAAIERIIGGGA
ncbi:MAG TPA: phosphotransferase [Pseudolysinimonas sp.]|nr:phosphotransferase [Pseudolysinimonas sp.]